MGHQGVHFRTLGFCLRQLCLALGPRSFFKSSYLLSQDCVEVNLYGIVVRYVVMVVNKKIWELWHDSHAVTIQWVHVIVDPPLSA